MSYDLRARLRETVEATPEENLPELVGALAEAQALAQLRLHENSKAEDVSEGPAGPPERLLGAKEAAALLGVDTRWLYDRADRLPFTRRLSPRTLRFSEPGILRWLETRR